MPGRVTVTAGPTQQGSMQRCECDCPFLKCCQQVSRAAGAQNSCLWQSLPPHDYRLSASNFFGTIRIYLIILLIPVYFSYRKKSWFSNLLILRISCVFGTRQYLSALENLSLWPLMWWMLVPVLPSPSLWQSYGLQRGSVLGDLLGRMKHDEQWGGEAEEWTWGSSDSSFENDIGIEGSLIYIIFV